VSRWVTGKQVRFGGDKLGGDGDLGVMSKMLKGSNVKDDPGRIGETRWSGEL
jgi:hypothetical protein